MGDPAKIKNRFYWATDLKEDKNNGMSFKKKEPNGLAKLSETWMYFTKWFLFACKLIFKFVTRELF